MPLQFPKSSLGLMGPLLRAEGSGYVFNFKSCLHQGCGLGFTV